MTPPAQHLSAKQHEDLAQQLFEAERDRHWVKATSTLAPSATVADAYAIASAVTRRKVASGRVVKGHKIGLVSEAMREASGATEPDYGDLFDNWISADSVVLPAKHFNRPLVEVETAFVLGSDLAGPHVTAVEVIKATEFVLPALEIVDSRAIEPGPNMLVDSISDAASCGKVILGTTPRKLTEIDLRREAAALTLNGKPVRSGVSSTILGSPVNAVAWLANKLWEYGVTLRSGELILPGSFLQIVPLQPGDTIHAEFTTLGSVGFRMGVE